MREQRRIVILAGADTLATDVTGPADVFSMVGHTQWHRKPAARPPYLVEVAGLHDAVASTTSGVRLLSATTWRDLSGSIDTLLVAGGIGVMRADQDPKLLKWLRERASHVRRVGSICTGAFLLGAAGLLNGKRATTHWRFAPLLSQRFPSATIDAAPIYVRDGKVYSSAGATAGIDLALAMVEEDHGQRVALEIARDLVLYLRRAGGQMQFSGVLSAQSAERDALRDLQTWIMDHLHEPLTVETLAAQAAMSARHLTRLFLKELHTTPARFIERLRVETARRSLEDSRAGVKEVAGQCGFGSVETMRRSFQKVMQVAPSEYRERFSSAL